MRILWDKRLDANFDGRDSENTWHEQLEILCFTSGYAAVECGFRRFICGADDIVIINPCEVHSVNFNSESPCFNCIMIDPRLYGGDNDLCGIKYIGPMTDRRLHFNNLISGNTKARAVLDDMIAECRAAETAYEVAVKGDILRLLAILFRTELRAVRTVDDIRRDTRDYERIAPALRYIAEHYTSDIQLDELSKCCCMNSSYFCRRFRSVTGQTAIAYINEYRIAKAEALLLTTSLSVSEIAARSGFSDSGYFSRKFHEARGCSPKAYAITRK